MLQITLFSLCWNAIKNYVNNMAVQFLESEYDTVIEIYENHIEHLRAEFCALPAVFQREVCGLCLSTADKIAAKCDPALSEADQRLLQLKIQLVVGKLVSVAASLKLKDLRFSDWSKSVQTSLLDHLWRMTSLGTLHCDFSEKLDGANQSLVESLPFLNLTEFSYIHKCNDAFIDTLLENGKLLQSVTLAPHPELFLENNFRLFQGKIQRLFPCGLKVNLNSQNLSRDHMQSLLSIRDVCKNVFTFCDEFGLEDMLIDLERELGTGQKPLRPFAANILSANLSSMILDGGCLRLIPKYFPFLNELELRGVFSSIDSTELPLIDRLENLEGFKLTWTVITAEELPDLLSLRCSALTSLCLEFTEMDGRININIADFLRMSSGCPNLKYLKLSSCSFFKNAGFVAAQETAFSKLKRFELVSSTTSCVELILHHASSIETICLRTGAGLTDEFILGVFHLNPLEHLRELYVSPENHISVRVLKLIASRCRRISFLGHFTPSDDELNELDGRTRKCLKNHPLECLLLVPCSSSA